MRVVSGFLWMLVCLCFLGAGAVYPSEVFALDFRNASASARHETANKREQDIRSLPLTARFANPIPELKKRSDTVLARRWAMTRARVRAEADWLRSCEIGACRDQRAEAWLNLVGKVKSVSRVKQPALVQKLVFGRVRYLKDRTTDDHWANPLSTLLQGTGDCEDHVLLKRTVLTAAGYPEAGTRLLILVTASGAGHMALEVDADIPLVLDNRYRLPRTVRSLRGDKVAAVATEQGLFSLK